MFFTPTGLFRYWTPANTAFLVVLNVVTAVPWGVAFLGPLLVAENGILGMLLFGVGLLAAGQLNALMARLIDRRTSGLTAVRGKVFAVWKQSIVEGLGISVVTFVLLLIAFQSIPYYWGQTGLLRWFSVALLLVGTLLWLGMTPYWFSSRRREGLSLLKSARRAFLLMNQNPLLSLSVLVIGFASAIVSVFSAGLFPGWAGINALHQAAYERVTQPTDHLLAGDGS